MPPVIGSRRAFRWKRLHEPRGIRVALGSEIRRRRSHEAAPKPGTACPKYSTPDGISGLLEKAGGPRPRRRRPVVSQEASCRTSPPASAHRQIRARNAA